MANSAKSDGRRSTEKRRPAASPSMSVIAPAVAWLIPGEVFGPEALDSRSVAHASITNYVRPGPAHAGARLPSQGETVLDISICWRCGRSGLYIVTRVQ